MKDQGWENSRGYKESPVSTKVVITPSKITYVDLDVEKDPRVREVNRYVSQPGSQDLTRPLCFNVVGGRPCVRVVVSGREKCWFCERRIE